MQKQPNQETECQKFFERLASECEVQGTGAIRGSRLRAEAKDRKERLIEWEKQVASQFSPGPVSDTETIRKALYEGQEIVEGRINRNTFSSLVDLGLSADRCEYATQEESTKRFVALGSAKGRQLSAFLELDVKHLRSVMCRENENEESQRAVAVYDTAERDNRSHAEAFLICKFSNTKPLKSVQADLMDRYSDGIIAVEP